jgi:AraC-like DNA-binding protein
MTENRHKLPKRTIYEKHLMTPGKQHYSGALHPAYARLLYVQLRERGIDADAVLAEAGLRWNELASDPRILPLETLEQLVLAAQRRINCPWLGLELGTHGQASVHGAVGHAAISSSTMRQLLQTVARFGQIRVDALIYTYQENSATDGGAILRVTERIPLGHVRRFILEAVFATLMRLFETAVGKVFASMSVGLPFKEPAWVEQYRRFGIGTLYFDSVDLMFHFPAALLNLHCLTADSHSYELAKLECERALSNGMTTLFSQRIKDVLLAHDSHESGLPELTLIAQKLQVSPRTLMRKLKSEGTSYQALLDENRKTLAIWHLQHSSASIEQIAEQLGYQDTSNFSRTFRRWCGENPREYRKRFSS